MENFFCIDCLRVFDCSWSRFRVLAVFCDVKLVMSLFCGGYFFFWGGRLFLFLGFVFGFGFGFFVRLFIIRMSCYFLFL